MRKIRFLLLMTLLLCLLCTSALAISLGKPKTYGGRESDVLLSATPVSGGGLLLAGHTEINTGDEQKSIDTTYPWAVCIDEDGEVLWDVALDDPGQTGIFRAATTLADGRFALIRVETTAMTNDSTIVILSKDGKVEGRHRMQDTAWTLAAWEDGFLVSLFGWGGPENMHRISTVAMMNADGVTLWTRMYEELPIGEIYTLSPATNGDMMMAGRMKDEAEAPWRGFVARLSGQELVWIHCTPEAQGDAYVSSIAPLADGGVAFASQLVSTEEGAYARMSTGKLDREGNLVWEAPLPGETDRHVVQITALGEGFVTASNVNGVADEDNETGQYIQFEQLSRYGKVLSVEQTDEMENAGLTVRFVTDDLGRTFLYGSSYFKDNSDFFVMKITE